MNATMKTLALACAVSCGGAEAASVHHVPADFPTIQAAINASSNGDTVLVDPGTYFELIDVTRDIAIVSTAGPEVTIIDGSYLGQVVTTHDDATKATRIEGFTITHGNDDFFAGGIFVSGGSPRIVGNIVTENLGGGEGNGITIYFSSGQVIGNEVTYNSNNLAGEGGGGGGGIAVGGDPCPGENCGTEIRGNFIAYNSATNYTTGGGIYLNAAGHVAIVGNVIRGNSVGLEGGGIGMFNGSLPRIENNLIVENQTLSSSGQGGGIYWLTPADGGGFAVGNTIVNNFALQGSGVYANGFNPANSIINNMIVGPAGSTGIECGSPTQVVRNNDVYVSGGGGAFAGTCAADADVDGNITAQPLFVGPDDYGLGPGSPGIDGGENAFTIEKIDIRGGPRIIDGNHDGNAVVDMGAYERPKATAVSLRRSGGH